MKRRVRLTTLKTMEQTMSIETTTRYCPICGKAGLQEFDRFGEWACSDAHADEHVAEVRAQKRRLLDGNGSQETPAGRPRRQFCGG